MDGARCEVVRRHDDVAQGPASDARRVGAVLDPRGRDRARVEGRHVEGALSHSGRTSGRGRAHALPRRTPFAVPVVPVGLPAHLHVLCDGGDAVRPEPDGVGDPRPGLVLPPERARQPRRLHGHGRAVPELRRRRRLGPAPARPRYHASTHDRLHGRLDARAAPLRRRGRPADSPRGLGALGRCGKALPAHARERPLPARRRACGVPALRRAAPPEGVRGVRHAGRRERLSGGRACARGRARRALLQGQPHPVQPDSCARSALGAQVPIAPGNAGGLYDGSSREAIERFKSVLGRARIPATVRLTRGRDIAAACGQLASMR